MCCIHGTCILAPGTSVSANLIFHPDPVLASSTNHLLKISVKMTSKVIIAFNIS